jgi:N-acetylmuramoyl-L-alanine amidase
MAFTLNDLVSIIGAPQPNASMQQLHDALCDLRVLAGTLDGEGRGETIHARAAIAWTVRNRREKYKADKNKPYAQVCLRRLQYSCWWPIGGEENAARTLRIMDAEFVSNPGIIPLAIWKRYIESKHIAQGVIAGAILDPTNGATHYLTRTLYNSAGCPAWAKDPGKISATIESHIFFRDIA